MVVDHPRDRFGVEPVCRVLDLCPGTYYGRKRRPLSPRAQRDAVLLEQIKDVHQANYGVYGARRAHRQLRRQGVQVARCTIERLMREHGLEGVRRGAKQRTTVPDETEPRPPDLVNRRFVADRPDQLWLADITYVAPGRAGCTWRSCWTPSRAGSWADNWPTTCAPDANLGGADLREAIGRSEQDIRSVAKVDQRTRFGGFSGTERGTGEAARRPDPGGPRRRSRRGRGPYSA